MTTQNLDTYLFIWENSFTSFPLVDAAIYIKTVPWARNVMDSLPELKAAFKQESPSGYCEKVVMEMTSVGNQALCGGTNSDVGFYYKVTFPVGKEGLTYAFKTPTDFGHGGISYLDGVVKMSETEDVWHGGQSTKLDYTVTLSKGNHMMELYGAEGCCDGTTSWSFQVNGGEWLPFTVENLNHYKGEHGADNPCDALAGSYDKQCTELSGWHSSIDTGSYSHMDLCTVSVSAG